MQQRSLPQGQALEGQAKLQRVLRELPAKPTQRNAKQHEGDVIAESRRLDCGAFDGMAAAQEQQLAAFEDAWGLVEDQLKELRQRLLTPMFEQVRDFARTHAAGAASSSWSEALVPTVLLSTGMSADHAHTYPDLMFYLRSQGHSVALVSARDVQPSGAGLGGVLQSALRQFMGAATHADDMQALLAWWAEEVEHAAAGPAAAAAAAAAGGAAGRGAVRARERRQSGHGAEEASGAAADRGAGPGDDEMEMDGQQEAGDAEQGGAGPSSRAGPSNDASQKRELRPRQQPPGGAAHTSAARRVLQPPVLIVQEAEGSDMGVMQDLVTLLRQERPCLPLTLVLGFSTAPWLFEQLLPSGIGRRIAQVPVALPAAGDHLHALWRGVLLRGAPPALVLGPQCAAWVLRHFREVDASTALLENVMQLACMEHFLQQPLSALAPAITSGDRNKLHSAVQKLPKALLQRCHAAVTARGPAPAAEARGAGRDGAAAGGSRGPSEASAREAVEAAVWHAMQAYAKWRLAVLLVHAAAAFTGAADGNASLQLPFLYAAASSPDFHTASRGQPSEAQMLLQQLSTSSGSASVRLQRGEQCAGLLQRLLVVARAGVAAPEPQQEQQQGPIVVGGSSSDSSDSESEQQQHEDKGRAAGKAAGPAGIAPLLHDCTDVVQLLAMLEALASETADSDASSDDSDQEDEAGQQEAEQERQGAVTAGLGLTPLAARLKSSAHIRTPTQEAGLASPPPAAAAAAGASPSGLGMTPLAARLAQAVNVRSPPNSSRAKENRQRQQAQPDQQQQLQRPSRNGAQEHTPAKPPLPAAPAAAGSTPTQRVANPGSASGAAKATPNARTARLMSITRAAQPAPVPAPAGALRQLFGRPAAGAQLASVQRPGKTSPAFRLAAALEEVLPRLMVDWARCPPAAAAFMYDDVAMLQSVLSPAPRLALHDALAHPNTRLPGCAAAMGPEWEDACIAYGLLERHEGEVMATAEWFEQFASVHGLRPDGKGDEEEQEEEEGGGRAKRGRAGSRRGRGGKTKVRPDDAAEVATAQRGRRQRVTAARAAATAQAVAAAGGAGPSSASAAGQVDEKKLLDVAGRFCQAASELQFVGAFRPTKRRKVASVQRTLMPLVVQDQHGPGV